MALVVDERPFVARAEDAGTCSACRLPIWLCPRADAYESVENGRFHFHVEIRHPLTGLIVRYRGSLSRPTGLDTN